MSLFFTSCEEVVDVDLNAAAPKLVIEAAINWKKGTSGAQQTIKLTTTANYFEDEIPIVSGATVYIRNSANQQFNFTEVPQSGRYVCNNFKPVIEATYTLTVINNSDTYTATETLKSIVPITRITQNSIGEPLSNDIIIRAFYNDPATVNNYYLYKYVYSNKVKSNYYVDEDKFFQGNEFFSVSDGEDLKTGDEVEVTHYGISKQYYNYMSILISIAGSNIGGPFQSPPATVKGNIINTTDKNNYPLGYFSLSEIVSKKYTIK
ncbi:MAG: DUF4249 family protein [Flavobacterium sp.]